MIDKKNVLNGVRTVVLDVDGTLYDKSGLAHRMVRRLWWCLPLLAAERLARRTMHEVQYSSGEEFYAIFFRRMARGHWWGPGVAEKWYHHIYLPTMIRLIAKHHAPNPHVLGLIDECKRRKIPMAIYSDYGGVLDKLAALGINPKDFDLIVDAPELGALKPSAESARKVLELLHADPQTTLFVGDRADKDGVSAQKVGAKFYLIP